MSGCRFGSPDLITSISGNIASPTFAFDATNTNHLGLVGSFTSANGALCSFPARSVGGGRTATYAITPIIVTTSRGIGRTTTCSTLAPASINPGSAGSTTYSGIECPSIVDNRFSAGIYTLRFNQPNVNAVPSISSRVFIVGNPTFITDTVIGIITQTTNASVQPSSTITVTEYTSTFTETPTPGKQQFTTVTNTIRSCSSVESSSEMSSASSVTRSASSEPSQSSAPTSSPTPSSTTGTFTSNSISTTASTPTASLTISLDGRCGNPINNQTCLGSIFGNCCSSYGWCGASDTYCKITEDCQPDFGNCIILSPVSSSALPTFTVKVSIDGTCGGANGFVCVGSSFGDCCSPYGWCGGSTSHCGPGCQNAFGICSKPSGTAPQPTSTLKVSLNGACGGISGQTCLGSSFGDCCSEYGYCGSTSLYCGIGCQSTFGTCESAAKRALSFQQIPKPNVIEERLAIGGAGPDYTYPPIPHKTITSSRFVLETATPAAGVSTTTIFAVNTTTLSRSVITVSEATTACTFYASSLIMKLV